MTPATFLIGFPEFAAAETEAPGLIQEKLTDAELHTNADVMGVSTDRAIKLRTAIDLMRSPWARALRLEQPDKLETWEGELRDLQTMRAFGLRVFL